MKTFTVTDADAEKLAELLRENVKYRPDYFGLLATAVLWQFGTLATEALAQVAQQELAAQLPAYREECGQ